MDYIELVIGGVSYKLRLTVKNVVQLEKALGTNPIQIFMNLEEGQLPKLTEIIAILHASLQCYHHNTTTDKVYELYENYVSEGHTMFDLIPVIIDVFKTCGFVSQDTEVEDNPKN